MEVKCNPRWAASACWVSPCASTAAARWTCRASRSRRTARALRHLPAAGRPPDLGAQAVRTGGLAQKALGAPSPPQGPGLPPRVDTLAIARLRRGPPGGELPSFPRPVP
jgi:hypothetical protein